MSEFSVVAGIVVAAVLVTTAVHDAKTESTVIPSSKTALRVAEDLREKADELAYDDPRLAATDDFVRPDPSLEDGARTQGEKRTFERSWRITEHEPARFMKTIEIRVRWPHSGQTGELLLTTIKVS